MALTPSNQFSNISVVTQSEKGTANGIATLDANGKVVERLSYEALPNGVATLDGAGKLVQMPSAADTGAIPTTEKGVANGVATLDGIGKLVQMPTAADVGAVPTAEKGAANGVATLDATGKVIERLSYEGVANGVATLDANGMPNQGLAASAGKSVALADDTNLQTWADTLPASGLYSVVLTAAQGGLPAGWWYIELLRWNNDTAQSPNRLMMAYPATSATTDVPQISYINRNSSGVWSGWKPLAHAYLGVMAYFAQASVPDRAWTALPGPTIEVDTVGSGLVVPAWAKYIRAHCWVKFSATANEILIAFTQNGSMSGWPTYSRIYAPNSAIRAEHTAFAFAVTGATLGVSVYQTSGATIGTAVTAGYCGIEVQFYG